MYCIQDAVYYDIKESSEWFVSLIVHVYHFFSKCVFLCIVGLVDALLCKLIIRSPRRCIMIMSTFSVQSYSSTINLI